MNDHPAEIRPRQVLPQVPYIIYEELISFEITHPTLHPRGYSNVPLLVDFGMIGLVKAQICRALSEGAGAQLARQRFGRHSLDRGNYRAKLSVPREIKALLEAAARIYGIVHTRQAYRLWIGHLLRNRISTATAKVNPVPTLIRALP